MTEKCIDVSNWQGVISVETWRKIKATGINRTIIRCSYTSTKKQGLTMAVDKAFGPNVKNAHKAGMQIGAYHFSQAMNEVEASDEADFAIKTCNKYKKYITLPLAFDYESNERLTKKHMKAIAKVKCMKICTSFCDKVKKAGYDTMVYADLNTLNNYISADLSSKFKIWVAQYNDSCDYKKPYYMWQYTSAGKVPGIPGKVDLSYVYDSKSKISPGEISGKSFGGKYPTLPKRGYFKKGDKGVNVKRVQTFLVWWGLTLAEDGIYGNLTVGAVKAFQEKFGLTIDGEFGKECLDMAKKVKK